MKNWHVTLRKVLSLVMVFAMLLTLAPMPARAADNTILYLKPNSNWTQDNPRFAAYFFGNGEKWVAMTELKDSGIYQVSVPSGFTKVIFCRMNPGTSDLSWSDKWNQTGDLTIPTDGKNLFAVPNGSWDGATSGWSKMMLTVAGASGLCGSDWTPADSPNAMTLNGDGKYEKTFTGIAKGTYEFKVTNGSWDANWGQSYNGGNASVTVAVAGSSVKVLFDPATGAVTSEVTLPSYQVTFNGTNVTSNGAASVNHGESYTATLTAAEGYTLPETIEVTVGGTAITGYTYSGGVLTIHASAVTGDLAITAEGVELPKGVTVYCINSGKWDTVSAYAWTDGGPGLTWPGTEMTKIGEQVNGFDVYSVTFDTAYANVIFNNKGNGSQTADLTLNAGRYYDVKNAAWYASLSDVPVLDPLETDVYLVGQFNEWSTVANDFRL